jgi:hypothetical protein
MVMLAKKTRSYGGYIIVFTNKIFQWFYKLRRVRFELFSFVNNVSIETWMKNTPFDQISVCRIVFM